MSPRETLRQPGLVFDPARHAYFLHGEKLPSVTKITGNLYAGPRASPERLKFTADRGSEIHSRTETDDAADTGFDVAGWLKRGSQHAGERAAWRAWRRERQFTPTRIEARMASKRWGVAGTVDRIGKFRPPTPMPEWWTWPVEEDGCVTGIADIKTGAVPDLCAAQMAAYRHMAVELGLVHEGCPLVAVALRDSGAWWDVWYRGDGPDELWRAAWEIFNHRPDNYREPPPEGAGYTHRR